MNVVNDLKNKVLYTIKNYYIGIIFFMLSTIGFMMMIREGYYNINLDEYKIKLSLTFLYGGILSIIIKEMINRFNKLKFLYIFIPVILFILYFLVLNNISIDSTFLKFFMLCVLSALLFIYIPFIGKNNDSEYYTYKIINSLLITGICYLILVFGIVFISYSLSSLFEITIKRYLIAQVLLFILGFFMPALFLTGIPKDKYVTNEYPNFIKKGLIYIIFPILLVYTVILYSYFIKILIEFKWPLNVLGNLVMSYLIISILFLYFNNRDNTNSFINKLVRIYPYLLIIPATMMVISFILRINEYGFTEFRYFSIILFIFTIFSIVLIKLNKKSSISFILVISLFISTFGPLSAFNVSKNSQINRLEKILIDNSILIDNKIVRNENISKEVKSEIKDLYNYIKYNHGIEDVEYLPNNFDIENIIDK